MTKVGKPDYEGTFVGTRGNGRDAPRADLWTAETGLPDTNQPV